MTSQVSPATRVVIVGASLAGIRTALALRKRGFAGSIVVIGDESVAPYDRPPLSKQVLDGSWSADRTKILSPDRAAEEGIDLRLGTRVETLSGQAVRTTTGIEVPFDVLVAATGVRARTLDGQMASSGRVASLRTLADAHALRAHLLSKRSLMVVGGGFIGGEVASAARKEGLQVSVLEVQSTPFAAVLGTAMGKRWSAAHDRHGVRVRTGLRAARVVPSEGACVELEGGGTVEADCAVVGVGTAPNVDWLPRGIADRAGIRCDATGRVRGLEGVYAVGDVACWVDPRFGDHRRTEHWGSAVHQAETVAAAIATPNEPATGYQPPYFWSDQYGKKLQVVGRTEIATDVEVYTRGDEEKVWAHYLRDKELVGVAGVGLPRTVAAYRELISVGATVDQARALAREQGAGRPLWSGAFNERTFERTS